MASGEQSPRLYALRRLRYKCARRVCATAQNIFRTGPYVVGDELREPLGLLPNSSLSTWFVMPARLHLDGAKTLWALVRCDVCTDVDKYPALEAARTPVLCKKCGHSMDVRAQIAAAAAKRIEVPGELLGKTVAVPFAPEAQSPTLTRGATDP
jgi:hypothetical protein